ncbi:MAG: hypoxanthine phosphoribosyltransferase, partial [Actinomycetales bacterium]
MQPEDIGSDLAHVLLTEDQISERIQQIADQIERDYDGADLLLVGVLKGAVMIMADLARALTRSSDMDW